MANCVDPDEMIHFRNYIIWVHTVYSHVNMHIVRTWSNQSLVESGKPASKTTCWMANWVDPDQIVQLRSILIWVHTLWSRVKMHNLRTWSIRRIVKSSQPASKLLVWMANYLVQMVHFRSYGIWVRAVYSRVNIHILRRWSHQCLVESSKLRPKLRVWMEDCVNRDQIVHFRSYAIWVRAVCIRVQTDMLRTWSDQRLISRRQHPRVQNYWLDGKLWRPIPNGSC